MSGLLLDEIIVDAIHRPGEVQRMLLALARERLEVHGMNATINEGSAKPRRAMRLIMDRPELAAATLKKEGYSVKLAPVLVVPRPATLFELELSVARLVDSGIVLEALYTIDGPTGPAVAIATADAVQAAAALGELLPPQPTRAALGARPEPVTNGGVGAPIAQ